MRHKSPLSWIAIAVVLALPSVLFAQEKPQPDRIVKYKTVGDVDLHLHLFEPKTKSEQPRPAIVFFFGGGWVNGTPSHFYEQCRHLADQGMVAFSAEYRVRSRNQTTPFECVQDGKSALRWVRSHAEEFQIDPQRIAAGGGSAGGHVAAAVATVPGLNEPGEPTEVSCVPNALVLFNPVYDNGPGGYGHDRVKDRYQEISPMHNIRKGMPPAIVFLGTKDKLIPVETGKEFQKRMQDAGSRSELKLYENGPHGFFNSHYENGVHFRQTLQEMDEFLADLGYIQK